MAGPTSDAYPTLSFRSRSIEGARPEAGDRFRVVGDLTIRDVTREVVLEATYEGRGKDPWGGERVSFSATTKIDRRDFGLTWGAALTSARVAPHRHDHLAARASRGARTRRVLA